MNHWKITALSLLALTLAAVLVGRSIISLDTEGSTVANATSDAASERAGTAIGETAPGFQLTLTDGVPISLSDLRGQPAVIVFWTAWCPACKEEAPRINKLAGQFEPLGVRVLGINIQDSLVRAEAGIKDFGIRYPVARDPDASIARRYKVTGTPTIVFLDHNGVVRYIGNELPQDYPDRLGVLITREDKQYRRADWNGSGS